MGKTSESSVVSQVRFVVSTTMPIVGEAIGHAVIAQTDLQLLGTSHNRAELESLLQREAPIDVLLIVQPHVWTAKCVDFVKTMKHDWPSMAIIAMSDLPHFPTLIKGVQAGVDGWISSKVSTARVFDAIRAAYVGEAFFQSQFLQTIAKNMDEIISSSKRLDTKNSYLTEREIEVITLASRGLSNKKIADNLFISERSVQSHLSSTFKKLGVNSRMEAVICAIKDGWILEES